MQKPAGVRVECDEPQWEVEGEGRREGEAGEGERER